MEPNYGYKHTKGFLVFILIVIAMAVGAVYAQTSPNTPSGYSIDSTTGNLLPNGALTSSTGITTTTGSPSWTAYPNPQGVFGADGYTFSYVPESLGWTGGVNLSNINHGYQNSSAVFVTGFSYGLQYRFPCANRIGGSCDDVNGTQDNLRVDIGYYPAVGPSEFRNHQLGLKNIQDGNSAYNPNWQSLAATWTFAGAKPLSQAGAVLMEIVGSDAGGWACLNGECYGPQVRNAYIRANYSVDPCILNPAFNPSCSGFQNILQGAKSPAFYYSYNIAQSLPHIGGGVILHGYDYGFNWYNYGACYNTFMFWCTDWRSDGGGNINFRISDKNNTTMFQNQWYVAGNNSGGSFSSRHLFTESKNSLDMGSLQWWTSDVWNHFGWVGWTRPIWTPDPCYTNGLYSPNCSNFQSTLTQVIADVREQQERIAALTPVTTSSSTSAPGGEITVTIGNATSATPSVTVNTASNTSTRSEQSSTSSNTQFALSLVQGNQRREQVIAMQASTNARQEASARAEAARQEALSVAEVNQQQGAASSDAAVSAAMNSITNSVSSRTSIQASSLPLTMSSAPLVNTVSSPSLPITVRSSPESQLTTATISTSSTEGLPLLSANLVQPSPVLPTAPGPSSQLIMPVSSVIPVAQTQPETVTIPIPVPMTSSQIDTSVVTKQDITNPLPPQAEVTMPDLPKTVVLALARPSSTSIDIPLSSPTATNIEPAVVPIATPAQVETKTQEIELTTSPTNFTTNRTNPITAIVEGTPSQVASAQPTSQTSTVNRTVSNNELAGGVSIDSIAVAPQGFNVYASLVLRDAAFYAPKEIYKGQKNVDNMRALRQLASDRLHQEMIDQQYRR